MRFKLVLTLFFMLFYGCSTTSSGNFSGEAAVLKYSTDEKSYHFADVSVMLAADAKKKVKADSNYNPYDRSITPQGISLQWKMELFSFDYSVAGQKGGFFFSLPVTIPFDIGMRPSFVQWLGPLYFGAGASFVFGIYPNLQDDSYKPDKNSSWGKTDAFILWSLGIGTMFDVTEKFSLGFYTTWERLAFNGGGGTTKNYQLDLDIDIGNGKEDPENNLPAYSFREMVTSFGIHFFATNLKTPLGVYLEYAPGTFFKNDNCWKLKSGVLVLY